MKALFYREYGGSEVLQYDELPRPIPGPRQVLVKVAATSFNPSIGHPRWIPGRGICNRLPARPGYRRRRHDRRGR